MTPREKASQTLRQLFEDYGLNAYMFDRMFEYYGLSAWFDSAEEWANGRGRY